MASDLIGRVQVPVKELMSKPGEFVRRTDKLVGFEDATAMSGELQCVLLPQLNETLPLTSMGIAGLSGTSPRFR